MEGRGFAIAKSVANAHRMVQDDSSSLHDICSRVILHL
jgi:hypothetical protein